ncbi:MAG: Calx-beta domain-containing protein, partial [Pseudomonadota bacterium]
MKTQHVIALALIMALNLGHSDADANDATGGAELGTAEETITDNDSTIVYVTSNSTTGNLGGRAGADGLCQAEAPEGVSNVHALLGVWDDDLKHMPANYGYNPNINIYWYNKSTGATTLLANSWDDMLDGNIENSGLSGTGYSGEVWTGVVSDGVGTSAGGACSYNPSKCSCGTTAGSQTKWTVGNSSSYGEQGDLSYTNSYWLKDPCPWWSDCSCGTYARLMCIGVLGGTSEKLQFSSATYSVAENEGQATISVTRTGNNGAVSVEYATSDNTAIAGSDYTQTSGTLNWSDGDDADKTFTINITDDSAQESDERLIVSLGNPTGGAQLGSPDTAEVTIIDNDSAFSCK